MSLHIAAFVALVIDLWAGGTVVEDVAGRYWRDGYEIVLLCLYLHFVWGLPRQLRMPGSDRDGKAGGAPEAERPHSNEDDRKF